MFYEMHEIIHYLKYHKLILKEFDLPILPFAKN